jgi:hypothetical protein
MTHNLHNRWAAMMLMPMWIHHQTTEVVAKCIDPELLRDPRALNDFWRPPAGERLNPLEFHGKRAQRRQDAC